MISKKSSGSLRQPEINPHSLQKSPVCREHPLHVQGSLLIPSEKQQSWNTFREKPSADSSGSILAAALELDPRTRPSPQGHHLQRELCKQQFPTHSTFPQPRTPRGFNNPPPPALPLHIWLTAQGFPHSPLDLHIQFLILKTSGLIQKKTPNISQNLVSTSVNNHQI